MKVIAVIADIVGSRKLPDRGGTQKKLKGILEAVNQESDGLASPYTITLGDEFQAVYRQARGMFRHFWQILTALHPIRVRFSIGVGEIVTDINPEQALGMDGPAFHCARRGIEEELPQADAFFLVEGGVERENFINNSLALVSQFARTWKKNRLDILHLMYEGHDAAEIAGRLDLSLRAVYKNIEKGGLDKVIALNEEIEDICQKRLEES